MVPGLGGPDLRAGRLLAGSPVLDGRLGDPPLPRPYRVVRAIPSSLHKSQSRRSLGTLASDAGERAGVLCLGARSNNDDSNKADAGERNRTRRFRDDVRAERQAIRPKCKSLP